METKHCVECERIRTILMLRVHCWFIFRNGDVYWYLVISRGLFQAFAEFGRDHIPMGARYGLGAGLIRGAYGTVAYAI